MSKEKLDAVAMMFQKKKKPAKSAPPAEGSPAEEKQDLSDQSLLPVKPPFKKK